MEILSGKPERVNNYAWKKLNISTALAIQIKNVKPFAPQTQGLQLIRLNHNAPLKPTHIKRSIFKRLEKKQHKEKVAKSVNSS